MLYKRCLFMAPISIFIFVSSSLAVPSIPSGPEGTILSCQEAEDQFGCFGELVDTEGNSLRRRQVKRMIKREYIRPAKRARRQARRAGDFELAEQYTNNIATYKSILSSARECLNWEDFECGSGGSGGGGGGEGGGGTGGGSGGNQNVASACTVLSGVGADRNQRIINGAICEQAEAAIVPIYRNGSQHCTGNYVGDGVILTAGHCVSGFDCTSLSVKDGSGTEAFGSSCSVHPNYDENAQTGFEDHDVAVIRLDRNLSSRKVEVVTSSILQVGSTILLAGYGRNETELSGENLQDFRAGYNVVTQLTGGGIYITFDPNSANQSNSCNGDSGGGALAESNGKWILVGTVSWGIKQNCGMNDGEDTSVWADLSSQSIQSFLTSEGII